MRLVALALLIAAAAFAGYALLTAWAMRLLGNRDPFAEPFGDL
jgi:hypothetical protein